MNTPEITILVWQTIILAITCLVIVWYTLETRWSRQASEKHLQKMRALQKPLLEQAGSSSSNNRLDLSFRNIGGTAIGLGVMGVPSGCIIRISPKNLKHDQIGKIAIENKELLPEINKFKISYSDLFGAEYFSEIECNGSHWLNLK